MKSIFVSAVFLASVTMAWSSCSLLTDEKHFTKHVDFDSGIFDIACSVNGKRLELGEKRRVYKECMLYQCHYNGLERCGFGATAAKIKVPEGCKLKVTKKCQGRLVQINNGRKRCNKTPNTTQ